MTDPTREQVRTAIWSNVGSCADSSLDAAADAVMAFLAETPTACPYVVTGEEGTSHCRLAEAAGQGWRAAKDEAEKALEEVVTHERTIAKLTRELRNGDLQRERQRQDLADANRWMHSYKGLPFAELRASLEAAVRHSDDYGLSSVCVNLPTGEDLLALLSRITERAT